MALLKEMQKYCRRGKRQAERFNKAAVKQLKELDWLEELASIELAKPLIQQGAYPSRKRRFLKWGAVAMGVLGLALLANGLFRIYKRNKANSYDDTRFDFFDEFAEGMNQGFDFDHASLDELEEALLKAEREVSCRLEQ